MAADEPLIEKNGDALENGSPAEDAAGSWDREDQPLLREVEAEDETEAGPRKEFSFLSAFRTFFFLLLAYRIYYISASPLGLSPEEAYYWCFAQHPALSYFDHPPMVAWIITLFTKFIGTSEFAIRLGAVLLSMGTTYVTFILGARIFNQRAGFFAAVALNLAFVFNVYATGITPDSPLLFFWVLGMYWYFRAWQDGGMKWWGLAGAAVGCALLSKYTAVFLPVSVLIFLLREKADGKKWAGFISSAVVSAIVFLPVIIWNFQNHFASFKFQTVDRASSSLSLMPGKVLSNFLGGVGFQMAFMSLLLFVAMVLVLVQVARRKDQTVGERFLVGMSAPTLLFMLGMALVTWIKTNWPTPGYMAALVLLGCWVSEHVIVFNERRNLRAFASTTVLVAIILVGLAQVQPFHPQILPALSKANTMAGWPALAERVQDVRYSMPRPRDVFYIGDGYQIASELTFYGDRNNPVYSSNVFGKPALAYDFWQPDLSSLKGRSAILVTGYDRHEEFDPKLLETYFERYQELKPFVVKIAGVEVRKFRVFKCIVYRGIEAGKK